MAGSDRWYFTKEVLANTPSRRCGIDSDKELSYRQQAANLIQDMGQRLHVSQLCINTAIVYMHRFYTFHSFTKFHRNSISSCALFLAAKVEEQPRKLEHVIKVSHMCLHREIPPLDIKSEAYQEQAMELVFNENLMLQTLGFDIAVEHPHTSVVNCCQLVRASKDLAQTSYFMATNSLHLTTMCLQYKPTVVACVCIHLACKWSSWEIPRSSENKDWFYYVDPSVTLDLLEQLTSEFLAILDKCPSRLKRKILSGSGSNASATVTTQNTSFALHKSNDEKKSSSHIKDEPKPSTTSKSSLHQSNESISSVNRRSPSTSPLMKKSKGEQSASQSQSNKIPVAMSYAAYRERKERANTQPELSVKPTEQLTKSNKQITHMKEKGLVSAKLSAKQQQINFDKQKQYEERHKNKAKNPEFLFDNNSSLSANPSKAISASLHQKSSQNNITTEDFYDNLLNKPSNFNSIFSTDGEDSFDFKREITTDLKMEFSDNSNQSNDGLNLNTFPSDFMNDSSESKKSLINNNNNNNNSNNSNNNININPNFNNNCQTSVETKPTSFMSIFSTPLTNTNSITTPTVVPLKSDNAKIGIPPKYNDIQSVLSRIKPEPPPPMLSPLNSSTKVETISKPDKQSFSSYSSAQSYVKTNSNLSSDLDIKQFQISKVSKTSPKPRNPYIQPKNSIGLSVQSSQTLRDKEVNESLQNVKLEDNGNQLPIETQTAFNSILNLNSLSNNSETIGPVDVKPEKPSKAAEIPSVLCQNRPQTSNPYLELETKSTVDSQSDQKILQLDPSSQPNPTAAHNKEIREKPSQSQDEKHHKHSHHSHKSSKHKDKHKHKHKDKDRERHKRKDKDKDRDRERDRDKHLEVSWSSPKDKPDVSNNSNTGPIKLKISKKKLSVDEPDKDNDVPQNPLKLRIQLKDQKLTANPTEFESNDTSFARKRKSSPKSSKKEKLSKYETESNFGANNSSKLKEDKSSGKTSSKSKKSIELINAKKGSNNSILDDKHSPKAANLAINSFGQQMLSYGQTDGLPVPQPTQQRSSKAHK